MFNNQVSLFNYITDNIDIEIIDISRKKINLNIDLIEDMDKFGDIEKYNYDEGIDYITFISLPKDIKRKIILEMQNKKYPFIVKYKYKLVVGDTYSIKSNMYNSAIIFGAEKDISKSMRKKRMNIEGTNIQFYKNKLLMKGAKGWNIVESFKYELLLYGYEGIRKKYDKGE